MKPHISVTRTDTVKDMKTRVKPHSFAPHTYIEDVPKKEISKAHGVFDLIHKWNLSEFQIDQLVFYTLRSRDAARLANNLIANNGQVRIPDRPDTLFSPIYQNVSPFQILLDQKTRPWKKYWLSFRETRCGQRIVLIQRDNKDVK